MGYRYRLLFGTGGSSLFALWEVPTKYKYFWLRGVHTVQQHLRTYNLGVYLGKGRQNATHTMTANVKCKIDDQTLSLLVQDG
jgi:hypothetical protein